MTALPVRLGPSAASRCRRRVHLDWAVGLAKPIASASAHRAMTELAEHREAVLRTVRAARGLPAENTDRTVLLPRVAAPSGDLPAQVLLAPERIAPVLVDPVLITPGLADSSRSGWPDLLVWAGDGYQPVIIRAHRTLDPGQGARCSTFGDPAQVQPYPTRRARRSRVDVIALAHHYRQLTELGWASSTARGGVIGRGDPGDESLVVWHDLDLPGASVLDDYDRRFTDRLAVAGAAASGAEPLALPSRIAECRRCPWWPRCSAELEQARDVSLLVAGGDVALLQAAGVQTIDQLAELPPELAAKLRLGAAPISQSRVRARAFQRGIPLVRIGRRGAIRRADVELDVDSESYGQDGAYLWGTYLSGTDVGFSPGYRPFATWRPLPSVSQAQVFVEFYRFLLDVRAAATARGLSFAAFCYARTAEERWMRAIPLRYPELAGMPTAREIAEFCAAPDWVDVHAELKRLFLPTGSLRLKAVATALGFSWRDPEPGGENSLAWYRSAVGAGSAAPDPEMAQRILRYNEDDVHATLAVREWLGRNGITLPTVADLEAGTAVTGITEAASAAPRPAG
ncbi:MAG TPA: TM0106 family RecB-like putative nuclease [Nakamurella sp.]|nr:TM0106 family RecB-like putative nuclease [Nakamurella sp.]